MIEAKQMKWCDPTMMGNWSDEEIRDFYDNNPNLSIQVYAGMLGLATYELKNILMGR